LFLPYNEASFPAITLAIRRLAPFPCGRGTFDSQVGAAAGCIRLEPAGTGIAHLKKKMFLFFFFLYALRGRDGQVRCGPAAYATVPGALNIRRMLFSAMAIIAAPQ
jgi:hypothetical protein